MTVVFANARIVGPDAVFDGHLALDGETIVAVEAGPARGVDCGGDYLIPGLVEVHTDHLEAHYMPRPKVAWNAHSAVLAYDAQIASCGITTVFDSLRVGIDEHEERQGFGALVFDFADLVRESQDAGHLRAEHLTHIRCEVPAPDAVSTLEAFADRFPVSLVSLMDHTPGQRQFRDIDKYFIYYGGKTGKGRQEMVDIVARRQDMGTRRATENRPQIVAIARARGIKLASHDDTTVEEVRASAEEGVTVAEFPTTLEAAHASRVAGMSTIMGAPNVVRGGSHSGNIAARALADAGLLDILSSDYVPASLLMGAFRLADSPAIGGLAGAIALVSRKPAEALGLSDRGVLAPGKRADYVRVAMAGDMPIVREVYRAGRRVA